MTDMPQTEKIMRLFDKYAEMIMNMQWLLDMSRNRKHDRRGWDAFCIMHDLAHLGARCVNIVRQLETGEEPDRFFYNALYDSPEECIEELMKARKKREADDGGR